MGTDFPDLDVSYKTSNWIPLVALVLGFGAQIVYFSMQFGSLQSVTIDLQRRLSEMEHDGPPQLPAIRIALDAATRRVQVVEELTSSKTLTMTAEIARLGQAVSGNSDEIGRLRDFRIETYATFSALNAREAVLESHAAAAVEARPVRGSYLVR